MVTTEADPNEQIIDLARVRKLAKSGRGREIRLAAGLSLADIAHAIGVATPTVQRWELGTRRPHGAAAHRYGALMDGLERMIDRESP